MIEAFQGDEVHDLALDRTRWLQSRAGYVAWCALPTPVVDPRAQEHGLARSDAMTPSRGAQVKQICVATCDRGHRYGT